MKNFEKIDVDFLNISEKCSYLYKSLKKNFITE